MSGTIRSFSFLIKPKSLFFELIDELTNNKDKMDSDELICYLIRMFGGTNIKVPSLNELRLFQYLIVNADRYKRFLISENKDPERVMFRMAVALKQDYHGDLTGADVTQIVAGFMEAVSDMDIDEAKIKKNKEQMIKKRHNYKNLKAYKAEALRFAVEDDCPVGDDIDE